MIFNDCLNEGKFPHEWKKANVVLSCTQERKQRESEKLQANLFTPYLQQNI